MFGNLIGWLISAGIALGMGTLLFWAASPGSPTPPTGTLKISMQPATFPVDPSSIVPAPTKDADAGDLYREAIADGMSNADKYEKDQTILKNAVENEPDGVKKLIEASDCKSMHLFDKAPDQVVTYQERKQLSAIENVGNLCNQIANYYATDKYKNPEECRKHAIAAFNLGRHLYEERVVFTEWVLGTDLMQDAAAALGKLEPDNTKAETYTSFMSDLRSYRVSKIQPLWQIISGIDKDTQIIPYAGDIMVMAGPQNPERMWRVEAILKLGRYRYYSGTRGNLHAAKLELRELAKTETDPITQLATQAANNLTAEDYGKL